MTIRTELVNLAEQKPEVIYNWFKENILRLNQDSLIGDLCPCQAHHHLEYEAFREVVPLIEPEKLIRELVKVINGGTNDMPRCIEALETTVWLYLWTKGKDYGSPIQYFPEVFDKHTLEDIDQLPLARLQEIRKEMGKYLTEDFQYIVDMGLKPKILNAFLDYSYKVQYEYRERHRRGLSWKPTVDRTRPFAERWEAYHKGNEFPSFLERFFDIKYDAAPLREAILADDCRDEIIASIPTEDGRPGWEDFAQSLSNDEDVPPENEGERALWRNKKIHEILSQPGNLICCVIIGGKEEEKPEEQD